ncbi:MULTISPECIES: AEC family transporter [Falsihalocynthiibacter]|uniref:AEC family transporter n=1 Tax=Falsihalocynthiibacter TaxID=2854182 RepID=UPI003001AE1D
MLAILAVTLPIYLIILLGYVTVRVGYSPPDTINALSQFTVRVCLPALIFSALTASGSAEALNWGVILGYLFASLAALFIGYGLMRRIFQQGAPEAWVHGLGIANSNSGFIGFAIASMVFPQTALPVLAWIMIVENAVIIPLAMISADVALEGSTTLSAAANRAFRSFIRNPLVLSIIAALTVRGIGLPLPEPLIKTIQMLASVAPVIALFVVGGIVARFNLSPFWRRTTAISVGKLVLHPALVFAVLSLWPGLAQEFVLTAVLFAAVPMLSIYPILGAKYGAEQVCATAFIVTVMLSFFTTNGLIWWMGVTGAVPLSQ